MKSRPLGGTFCIRLLDACHPVLLGTGTAISHYESPKRSWKRMDYYGSRNLMLFAFFNVPTSVLMTRSCTALRRANIHSS